MDADRFSAATGKTSVAAEGSLRVPADLPRSPQIHPRCRQSFRACRRGLRRSRRNFRGSRKSSVGAGKSSGVHEKNSESPESLRPQPEKLSAIAGKISESAASPPCVTHCLPCVAEGFRGRRQIFRETRKHASAPASRSGWADKKETGQDDRYPDAGDPSLLETSLCGERRSTSGNGPKISAG